MIQHFVITRFNLRAAYSGADRQGQPVLSPGWMRERIELFERFCLPSMVHQANQNFTLSSGNVSTASAGTPSGYSITVQNPSISGTPNSCTVVVGMRAASTIDGVISCP